MLKCSKSWTGVSQKHVQRTCTSTILPEWWWQILKHPWVWFFFGFQADGRCWQGLKVVFRILQDFHELQTFKHDPILSMSIQSSLVQGHRSNFHHIHLNTGFWPGFWHCKGIQQVEQLNLNGDDEHGHRKEFWCFPPWKRFENEVAPRLTAWRAWA